MIKSENVIEILLPIEQVMKLFKNEDFFQYWQKGLVSSRPLSGIPGEVGSKRDMKIKVSGTVIHMKEEITAVDLPHLWEATYRTSGVVNLQSNRFRESETIIKNETVPSTLWKATSIFKFTGMMRIIAKTRPQLFTSQTYQHMKDFKIFAESKTPIK
ncbi:SRPBCC family protein [uncultured Nonlabens sp.]|uniref:SRPBCC family protein n=1 Tax=uncultured Nonlabens sp. TaxID=859306 RepID=UPI00261B8748|nr:SRPBCC family protein [uncultured Nonlabens sp.]